MEQSYILLVTFLLIFAIQILFFIFAFLLKTDKFTDFAYGTSFIISAGYVLVAKHDISNVPLYMWVLFFMITLWGLRLAIYLFVRIIKMKKDKRFDEIRNNFFKFAGFWILQTITIFIVSLPVYILFIFKDTTAANLNAGSILGIVVWIIGFTFESVADSQKFKFRNKPNNSKEFIDSGLWSISRHPNYFGEILCWIGVFIYAISFLGLNYFYIILSPVFISVLLIFVSGIPLSEKSMDKRLKDNKEYQEYKKSVPILVPFLK